MSGSGTARSVAAVCAIACNLLGSPAAALPVAEADLAQAAIETVPDSARVRVAAIDPAAAFSALPLAQAEPFGRPTRRVTAGGLWAKWHGVEVAIRAERAVLARCRAGETCPPAATRFLAIVTAGRAHVGRARLGQINRAVNLAIRPMSDVAQHGVVDRWSSPLATLAAGLGDCEDYAIAKYLALQEAGVAPSDLRLVIVREEPSNIDHAVVAARLDGRWIVLDNRHLVLVADSDLRRVVPLFTLDGDGVKQFAPLPIAIANRAPPRASGPVPADF
jgi:predicted transglutaminase-like cysteine proteinase